MDRGRSIQKVPPNPRRRGTGHPQGVVVNGCILRIANVKASGGSSRVSFAIVVDFVFVVLAVSGNIHVRNGQGQGCGQVQKSFQVMALLLYPRGIGVTELSRFHQEYGIGSVGNRFPYSRIGQEGL